MAEGVGGDEFFAYGDLDGVTDHGDLDLAAAKPRPDPVAAAGEAHVAESIDLAVTDAAVTEVGDGGGRRPRARPAVCLSRGCRRAWVAMSTPRWWSCTRPPSQTTSTDWPANHTPALYLAVAKLIDPLVDTPASSPAHPRRRPRARRPRSVRAWGWRAGTARRAAPDRSTDAAARGCSDPLSPPAGPEHHPARRTPAGEELDAALPLACQSPRRTVLNQPDPCWRGGRCRVAPAARLFTVSGRNAMQVHDSERRRWRVTGPYTTQSTRGAAVSRLPDCRAAPAAAARPRGAEPRSPAPAANHQTRWPRCARLDASRQVRRGHATAPPLLSIQPSLDLSE